MASETNWMLCLLDICSSLLSPCQWSFQRVYSSLTQIVSMVSSPGLARCMNCFQIILLMHLVLGLCACMSQISTFCSICFSLQGTASYWKRPHFEGAQQISSSCCSLVEACWQPLLLRVVSLNLQHHLLRSFSSATLWHLWWCAILIFPVCSCNFQCQWFQKDFFIF